MKKIFLGASLLLLGAVMMLSTGCTGEEVVGGAIGIAAAPFVVFGVCFSVIMMLLGLFFLVIWIIALIDCAKRKPDEFPPGTGGENAKTMWLVILIVTFFVTQLNGIAAIVYYFLVMKKMPRNK